MVENIKKSLGVSLWFIFLSFPFLAVRVNTLKGVVEWRWLNMVWVALAAFVLSLVWRWAMERRERGSKRKEDEAETRDAGWRQRLFADPKIYRPALGVIAVTALLFPWITDSYQTNIMVLALIFVVLGLGLNITVGLAGLLDLGYVAFFLVGSYSYGILNTTFGWGFWVCLPLGGIIGAPGRP